MRSIYGSGFSCLVLGSDLYIEKLNINKVFQPISLSAFPLLDGYLYKGSTLLDQEFFVRETVTVVSSDKEDTNLDGRYGAGLGITTRRGVCIKINQLC